MTSGLPTSSSRPSCRRTDPPFIDANPAFAFGSAHPSGHALEAAAVWGTALYVVSRYAPRTARSAVWIALGLLDLLQGVNRLYFGLHWASDVVVGWVPGTIWAFTCIGAARGEPRPPRLLREHPDRETSSKGSRRIWAPEVSRVRDEGDTPHE